MILTINLKLQIRSVGQPFPDIDLQIVRDAQSIERGEVSLLHHFFLCWLSPCDRQR